MHAHRCKVCAGKGENVVWIHGEDQKGIETAHKCPKCGSTEWEKWLVEVGQLPKVQQPQAQIVAVTIKDAIVIMLAGMAAVIFALAIMEFMKTINWTELFNKIHPKG